MQIVYQNQLLSVPQWKLTSDALTFLVELSSTACCISVLSKITVWGYTCRSMPMGMVITFPGNYCVGQGNTINKSISISLYLLNASCRLNEIAEKTQIKYMFGKSLGSSL
jgi:hypothetical protein